ncbi:MAG TPA: hypothetical protein VFR34_03485, partial [Paracoccaceae bacterium]|nr:hypothetical protein [Paracoccaceae bacterium]
APAAPAAVPVTVAPAAPAAAPARVAAPIAARAEIRIARAWQPEALAAPAQPEPPPEAAPPVPRPAIADPAPIPPAPRTETGRLGRPQDAPPLAALLARLLRSALAEPPVAESPPAADRAPAEPPPAAERSPAEPPPVAERTPAEPATRTETASRSLESQPALASPSPDPGLPAAAAVIPRVVIHHGSQTPPELAYRLGRALVIRGYPGVGIRQVAFGVTSTNLRFFHATDQAAAARLGQEVSRILGVTMPPVRDFTGYDPQPQPGTMEIWLAP